ncbi:methylmalonyl-CoA mutase family protein [candidate division KSB1 bacterium]|nr:methylmalonyl-CoA mutase family protein [candidate division KSB1 bacterium]NIR70402.1 methylmalonyl-CoA mutase family protein [candidate division KSB1 bacterium]NIS25942.1 methylmalonyl-CoA mutase family protein [candidate division KSB1 bacterium]NIT69965.1 methylmalonyl-CoA mutase family protein [candidate division KSB1 bacterium]NIU26630.1 methylmalonyl-CoA mutase family protein [candidate division KSB1 bacterium]
MSAEKKSQNGIERKNVFKTDSDIKIKRLYQEEDLPEDISELGDPGGFPYTRGIYPNMYRTRLWTMRQYSGYATARETNRRFRYLLKHGQTGLSVAFDLPTQMGYNSDNPVCEGEVGKAGVIIDSLEDMEILFQEIPLEKITTSMTINATAAILLALYVAVAKKQGADLSKISGTTQNDVLKEYIARATYIYPPKPSMRLVTDIFEYCNENLPKWNTISISGYHIREAGSNAVQELAFTFANAIAYVSAAVDRGLNVNEFGARLSYFFACHNNFFEEVAKFRAARRIWAKIMKERFGATNPKAMMLRFHTQTAGSTLTAQQPDNNVVRVTIQALAAVLGGTQSLHTNAKDEALALPSEEAARLALRTQQIIAHESGTADTVDPLAGSYFLESLTHEIENDVWRHLEKVDAMGGAVRAIEQKYFQSEITKSAYKYQNAVETKEKIIVGINKFIDEQEPKQEILRVDPSVQMEQAKRLTKLRENRDNSKVENTLAELRKAASGSENLLPKIIECVESYATLGETSDALREVFGTYNEVST